MATEIYLRELSERTYLLARALLHYPAAKFHHVVFVGSVGHADLAIVRSDIAMPPSGQTGLIMRRNAAVLFAPAQSGLRAIGDLRGHKVGILQTMPTGKVDNQFLLDTALAQYDVPPASVRRVFLSVAELARAIEHKEIDAVLARSSFPSPRHRRSRNARPISRTLR